MTLRWVAYYMPKNDDDPSKLCKTKKEAERYIESCLCKPDCESCLAEWVVVRQDKLSKCESFLDILKAAGFVKVEGEK